MSCSVVLRTTILRHCTKTSLGFSYLPVSPLRDHDLMWGCLLTLRSWLPSGLFACLSLRNIRSGKTLEHASKRTNLSHLCRNTSFHRYATRKFPFAVHLKPRVPATAESAAASRSGWPPPASSLTSFISASHQPGWRRQCASRERRPTADNCKPMCRSSVLSTSLRFQASDDKRNTDRSPQRRLIGGPIRSQPGSSTRQAGARRRSGMAAQNTRAPWPTPAKSIGCGSVASAVGHAIRNADLQMSIHGTSAAQGILSDSCRADTITTSNQYLTAASDATWGSLLHAT
jgi:hypothetical protein